VIKIAEILTWGVFYKKKPGSGWSGLYLDCGLYSKEGFIDLRIKGYNQERLVFEGGF